MVVASSAFKEEIMEAYKQGISKEEFVNEMKGHAKSDRLLRGRYWENGKGCAVGCGIESINHLKGLKLDHEEHSDFEEHLGWPEWFTRLEDTLFENVTPERSKTWPVEIAEAVNEGADLEKTKVPIIVMLLEHTLVSMGKCVFDREKNPDVVKALEKSKKSVLLMIEAQKSGDKEQVKAARSAAHSAAHSATHSAARSAAHSAAYSAAYSAAHFADSAHSAAHSAAYSAAHSAAHFADSAHSAAYSAARSAAYDHYADKILEIVKQV